MRSPFTNRDEATRGRSRTPARCRARHRPRHRRNVLHRLVAPRTLSQRSCLCSTCRRRSTANDIRPTTRSSPPQPQRRPPTQQRLYVVALARSRNDQATRDYRDRRRSEGKTDREIRRCLKRYIARRVWRLLEHPPGPKSLLDRHRSISWTSFLRHGRRDSELVVVSPWCCKRYVMWMLRMGGLRLCAGSAGSGPACSTVRRVRRPVAEGDPGGGVSLRSGGGETAVSDGRPRGLGRRRTRHTRRVPASTWRRSRRRSVPLRRSRRSGPSR